MADLGLVSTGLIAAGIGMPGPLASGVDAVAKKLVGQTFSRVFKDAQARFRAYGATLPPNQDLERGIRFAELTASLFVLHDYWHWDEETRLDSRSELAVPIDPFLPAARKWLHDQIGACPNWKLQTNDALTRELEAALDETLRSGPSDPLRMAAAARSVWAELVKGAGMPPPPELETRFLGQGAEPPGWTLAFLAYLRETLKAEPRIRDAFFLSRLAALADDSATLRPVILALRGDVGAMVQMLAELQTSIVRGFAAQAEAAAADRATLAEILATVRQSRMGVRATEAGISDAVLLRVAMRIAEQQGIAHPSLEDVGPWLENWIDAAIEQLARHTNEDAAFEAAFEEAKRRFLAGRADASAALMDEFAREERDEQDRQEERQRRRLRLLEEAARYDELALEPKAAVEKLWQMSTLLGYGSAAERAAWLFAQANLYYERGDQRGENSALLVAIAALRAVLEVWTRKRAPFDWAGAQNDLGNALQALGTRESGSTRLEQAVAAYNAALEVWTPDQKPEYSALAYNGLGSALQHLGDRESGTGRLNAAIAAFRMALKYWTFERDPIYWAGVQNNLGNALRSLGDREDGTERFEEAVSAYRAALEQWTRERAPLDWALTQNNLGAALSRLGHREGGTVRLKEAVEAFRQALEERTRDRVPLEWAATQCNLGNALRILSEREGGTTQLTEAVTAFHAALEEITFERVPLEWAGTTGNLALAFEALGGKTADASYWRRALTLAEQAMTVYQTANAHQQIVVARDIIDRLQRRLAPPQT